MKYKNYKSAIHNFTHSFISIDYMKSGHLAVNVLIDLYNLRLDAKSTFDFINQTIQPEKAESKESKQLLNDYLSWLPDHLENHNCDLTNWRNSKRPFGLTLIRLFPHQEWIMLLSLQLPQLRLSKLTDEKNKQLRLHRLS